MGVKVPAEPVINNAVDISPPHTVVDNWEAANGDMILARREPEGKDDDAICMVDEETKGSTVGRYIFYHLRRI